MCFLQGEIKISVTIEDEANKDLPSAVQLYRPVRQYVYGVLFSLAEAKKKAERLAMRRNRLPECGCPYPVQTWVKYLFEKKHLDASVEKLNMLLTKMYNHMKEEVCSEYW